MASGRLVFSNWMPALDADGVPIPNAQMFFYVNRTTTLATVYADEALTTPLANPVLADSSGQFVPVWADITLLFSAAVASTTLGQFDTIDDLAPSTTVGGAANKLDRDGGNPEPDFLTNVGAAAAVDVVPRLADIPALRAATWPNGRPPRVVLTNLNVAGDGGGYFRWIAGSTQADDGVLWIKEAATATGRWLRESSQVQGFRTTTLESLGAIGLDDPANAAADTQAFVDAALLIQSGWNITGLGNYTLNDTITLDTTFNPYWEEIDSPRPGRLSVSGSVRSTHDGLVFNILGNRGGAAGAHIDLGSLVGPGYASTSSVGFRLVYGGSTIRVGEILGYDTAILLDGCWSSTIVYRCLFNCRTGVKGQLGTDVGNETTNNDIYIYADHTGGPFMDVSLPLRRPVSVDVGFDLDHMTGCHFLLGDVQYCQIEDTSTGIILGPFTESCTLRAYIEGNTPYPETGQLLINRGRNNDCRLSATNSPDNTVTAITVSGLGNKIRGIGQRTGGTLGVTVPPSPVSTLSPDRTAGAIHVRPGNDWVASTTVYDHENAYVEPYNLSQQTLSIYGLSNASYAALTTGLPDTNNVQSGATFTVANNTGGAAISPSIAIAPKSYDRPVYVRAWARLVTGPATVAVYLIEPGSSVALQKAWISQGLDTVGMWQRIDLAAIIPAGQTAFRLYLAQRTVDDAQTGGCVVDWAFPFISWNEAPWSASFEVAPGPNHVRGNIQIDPFLMTQRNTTVDGAGVLDCNYAPLIRITLAAANIGVLANLAQGETTILNDTASNLDINTSTGLAAIKTITARRYVKVYRVGSSTYAVS